MREAHAEEEAPGQDSFLDVVANLVGIIIILVMVVGVRAKDAYITEANKDEAIGGPSDVEVASAKRQADSLELDVNNIAAKIKRHDFEVAYRRRERDKILLLMSAAEQALNKEKEGLTDVQREQLEKRAQVDILQHQIEDLHRARDVAVNSTGGTSVIEHLPTPMAKTVFGKELHFRLQSGRLTYIPWDDLVAKLKDEARQNVWKLKETDAITEEAGPIGGFRIRYTLKKVTQAAQTKAGPMTQVTVELDHFHLVPISDNLGEPFDVALNGTSQLRSVLLANDAKRSTMTVWVYPDSFDQYRELKAEMYKVGYLTAARPMPDGRLIGGSPHGTRSAEQ